MRLIIVFSSPNFPEYDEVWHRLIDQCRGYIKVNDSCDKIYVYDGHNEEYRLEGKWKTGKLIEEIDNIITNNNNCECVIMLHDRNIPKALTTRFPKRRFQRYSHTGSKFYENYIEPFRNGDKQSCFDSLWKELHKNKSAENTPKKGTKAHTRWLVENVIIHDCDNAITYLSIPINKILNDVNSNTSKEGQQTILDFGEDFIAKKVIYYASVKSIIEDAFPKKNNKVSKIPRMLNDAEERYKVICKEAKKRILDRNSSKVIVDNGQNIIRLLQETKNILNEVISNGK